MTTIANQLKQNDPLCHVTWAIAKNYTSAIDLNPYVDARWIVNIQDGDYFYSNLRAVIAEAQQRKKAGEFDHIIVPQIHNVNWHRFNGTIRGTMLSSCPFQIKVDVSPVVRLSLQDVEIVRSYVDFWGLNNYRYVLLFECAPTSGQSFINPTNALEISQKVIGSRSDICIILSSPHRLDSQIPHIKDGSFLSLRQNAELANYCTHLIGCSSGISWLCTSDWVRVKLPTIQFLSLSSKIFAGFEHDHICWGLSSDHIVEISNCSIQHAVESILDLTDNGIDECRAKFHEKMKPTLFHFEAAVSRLLETGSKNLHLAILISNFAGHNPHLPLWKIIYIALRARTKSTVLQRFWP